MPTGHPLNLDVTEAVRLYAEGLSCRAVAQRMGTNHTTIRKALLGAGVSLRDKGEGQRGKPKRKPTPRLPLVCPTCGQTFMVKPGDARNGRRYCSNACRGEAMKHGRLRYLVPKVQPFENVCFECGATFSVRGRKEHEKRRFCGQHCARRYLHRERWGTTVPERVIQALLVGLAIEFEAEKQFGEYRADLYLPGFNLVIECDGDYWHSLDVAKQAAPRKQRAYERAGVRVIHLTETQIKRDIRGCRDLILSIL